MNFQMFCLDVGKYVGRTVIKTAAISTMEQGATRLMLTIVCWAAGSLYQFLISRVEKKYTLTIDGNPHFVLRGVPIKLEPGRTYIVENGMLVMGDDIESDWVHM